MPRLSFALIVAMLQEMYPLSSKYVVVSLERLVLKLHLLKTLYSKATGTRKQDLCQANLITW